jgi:hypothetical protein
LDASDAGDSHRLGSSSDRSPLSVGPRAASGVPI